MRSADDAAGDFGHSHVFLGAGHARNERSTWGVIALCAVMMAAEIVGIRGAVAGLMAEVVEDHVRNHLIGPQDNAVTLDTKAAEQLIDVMHTYLK